MSWLYKKLNITVEGRGRTKPTTSWYRRGSHVMVRAYPHIGWRFVTWSGDVVSVANPTEVIMMATRNVKAIFERILNTITIVIEGSGTVTKSPDTANYIPGTSVVLTATPAVGWRFVSWTIDGVVSTENPKTMVA